MRNDNRTLSRVHAVDEATPEQRLAASLVRYAIFDASFGAKEPTQFFTSSRCLGWLSILTPEGADVRILQRRCVDEIRIERRRNGVTRESDLVID